MKTIAHFLMEDIKPNQRFIYNQITRLQNYHSIVIGLSPQNPDAAYPFTNHYNLHDIPDPAQFFKDHNVIAIHAHHGRHAIEILPICVRHNVPLVVSMRGRDASARGMALQSNKERYSFLARKGALFLPVCQYLADQMLTLGFPNDKIHILYGGIELGMFPFLKRQYPSDGQIRIVSIARLVEKKGFLTLLKAFKKVNKSHPNARLIIIGTGHNEQRIKFLIRKEDLSHAIMLKGFMTPEEIVTELKHAHLFCLASETAEDGDVEGIPNALKEAMASGIPVISTKHAGIPELVQHMQSGYLVNEKKSKELAVGIQYMINHPEIWPTFAQQARRVIEERFDLEKQILEQERLYSLI
jgi:glycosyltransferase involved in cell wall biosynthesis